jgi:hypothetical protein
MSSPAAADARNPVEGFATALAAAPASTRYAQVTHEHIQALVGIELQLRDAVSTTGRQRFTVDRYRELEQAVVEGGLPGLDGKMDIDTAVKLADEDTQAFDTWAGRVADLALVSMRDEASRQQWDRSVAFARNAFHNDATFRHLYGVEHTPWTPLRDLLSQGVFVALDQPSATEYPVIQARGVRPKPLETRVDDRYDLQQMVHAHLSEHARGYDQRTTCRQMCDYLADNFSIITRPATLQRKALAPLKRAGLIGSTSEGYFLLVTDEDCRLSIEFHAGKVAAMRRVIVAAERMRNHLAS